MSDGGGPLEADPDAARLAAAAKGLIGLRLALAVVAIGAVLIAQARGPRFSLEYFLVTREGAIYLLAVAACLINVPYLLILRWSTGARAARVCVWAQISLDLVLVAGLAWYDGGIRSPFVMLTFVPILASAWGLPPRATFAVAVGGVGLLSLVAALYVWGLVPGTPSGRVPPGPLVSPFPRAGVAPTGGGTEAAHFVQTSAFLLVALLAAELSRRIRSARVLADDVIASLTDGLVVLDGAGRIELANAAAQRILGAPLPPGASLHEALRRPEHRPVLELVSAPQTAGAGARKGSFVRLEMPRSSRDGGGRDAGARSGQGRRGSARPREPRPVTVRVTPVRGGGGEGRTALLVTLTDRTLERRVERAERLAERSQTVSELAASIAHEVRNPLASVRGAVQEIARARVLGEREQELSRIVLDESDRLDRMVGEFLQFARMREARPRKCALGPLLAEVRSLLAARAPGARLETDVSEGLKCMADAGQLRQVLLNLGLNAVEALGAPGAGRAPGGAPPAGDAHAGVSDAAPASGPVRLSARACTRVGFLGDTETGVGEEPGVVILVADSGCGMSAEVRRRALEPFFTTKTGGTGLGLAVVDRIMRAHGGEIAIESVPGAGTRVRLWLPGVAAGPGARKEPA